MNDAKDNKSRSQPLHAAIQLALLTLTPLTFTATQTVASEQPAGSIADTIGINPVELRTIDRTMIARSGHITLGDLLQELPEVGSDLNPQFNNGGNGETRINLRGLGCEQTLVLLNGRRWIKGRQGCVDVNQIALAVVERIELLDGGASALFGEGAVAGVVNIVTRTQFEGAQARAQLGKYLEHSDGEAQVFDVSIGSQSDRASVFFNASYVQSQPVIAGDRVISREPQYGTATSFGSSGTPQGRLGFHNPATGTFSSSWVTDPGCNVGNQGLDCFRIGDFSFGAPGSGADRFNFAPDNYLLTPQQRSNIFTQGRYQLTEHVAMSLEASYNNRQSAQQLAPSNLFLGLFGSGPAANIGVGALNPYNPTGQALPASSWLLGRRLVEAGPRTFSQDVDTYRFGLGLDGQFEVADRAWSWDLNYVYSRNNAKQITEGLINLQRVSEALSDGCVTGAIAGCVPLNVFGGANVGTSLGGTITQPMLDYIGFTAQDASGEELKMYSASIQGELFDLPAGPLGFTAGYNWRNESAYDLPDAIIQTRQTTGSARLAMNGRLKTRDIYASVAVPLLADLPAAKSLQLELLARRTEYSSDGTDSDSFRYRLNGRRINKDDLSDDQEGTSAAVDLSWKVSDRFELHGRFSRDIRVPNISQLHGGTRDSFPTFTDPCSGGAAANPDRPGCAYVPAGYQQSGIQYRITTGSNPFLSPESADTWTFGLSYQPSWLDGMDIAMDTYSIEIDDVITTLGINTITLACATSLRFCDLVGRASGGQPVDLQNVLVNEVAETVSGSDLQMRYDFGSFATGTLSMSWYASYLDEMSKRSTGVSPAGEVTFALTELTGTNQGDFAVPRWKSNLDLTWSNSHWDASWRMRYIHHQREACYAGSYGDFTLPPNAANGGQPYCNLGPDNTGGRDFTQPGGGPDGVLDYRKLGSVTYHDVQLTYHLGDWDTQLTFGVNNLFDKGPPLSQTAFANSFDSSVYETPGRFPYIRVTTDF
ncbi:MAG: TonB-dependent receptor [Lysobacteraceae bacterium]|nr:MAG: TonB-dependent receptor [Xanthomonadaceae bacterium]